MQTNIHFWKYLVHLFLEWKLFQTKIVEKLETYILWPIIFFFRKSCRLWGIVEKFSRKGQATDDSMVYAYWMLGTLCYNHTHTRRLYNTHCFYTTTTVHKRASVLRYMCINYRVYVMNNRGPRTDPWGKPCFSVPQ
jgi:hypothetical protein